MRAGRLGAILGLALVARAEISHVIEDFADAAFFTETGASFGQSSGDFNLTSTPDGLLVDYDLAWQGRGAVWVTNTAQRLTRRDRRRCDAPFETTRHAGPGASARCRGSITGLTTRAPTPRTSLSGTAWSSRRAGRSRARSRSCSWTGATAWATRAAARASGGRPRLDLLGARRGGRQVNIFPRRAG